MNAAGWSRLTLIPHFQERFDTADGRAVRVAVLDTGVDPGALHLGSTSTGATKVVDLIDATGSKQFEWDSIIEMTRLDSFLGSGDVDTSTTRELPENREIVGLSGRVYTVRFHAVTPSFNKPH